MAEALSDAALRLARDLQGQGLAGPELADAVEHELRLERPDTTTRTRQRAAARAARIETPEEARRQVEGAERQTRGRRRRGVRRARRRVARLARPRSPTRRTTTVAGIVAQTLGLVFLYWLIRNAGAAENITGALARAFRWLMEPRGIPGRAP